MLVMRLLVTSYLNGAQSLPELKVVADLWVRHYARNNKTGEWCMLIHHWPALLQTNSLGLFRVLTGNSRMWFVYSIRELLRKEPKSDYDPSIRRNLLTAVYVWKGYYLYAMFLTVAPAAWRQSHRAYAEALTGHLPRFLEL